MATVPAASGGARLLCVQWCPGGGDDASSSAAPPRLLAIDETSLRLFELRDGSAALATLTELPLGDDVGFVGGVSWDALHPSDVAVACDASIHVWDTRARARTRSIERAVPPGCCVRAVSFNSNKPWHLASGGDDYKVKVWDLRRPSTPVKILDGHTHWCGGWRGRGRARGGAPFRPARPPLIHRTRARAHASFLPPPPPG